MNNSNNMAIATGNGSLLESATFLLRSLPGSLLKPLDTPAAIRGAAAIGVAGALLDAAESTYDTLRFSVPDGENIDPLLLDFFFMGLALGLLSLLATQLTAAWRFHRGKGLVIGAILLTLTVVGEICGLATLHSDPETYRQMVLGVFIATGYVFGIRAAWASRKRQRGAS